MKVTKTKRRASHPRRFLRANRAVSALEYAILVGVIAVVVGAAIAAFGGNITEGIGKIGDKVKAPATSTIDADG